VTELFDIHFIVGEVVPSSECRYGEICIGTFRERFSCDVSFWGASRYERQWLEAAERIANGTSGVFIVSITDPNNSNFIRWWAAYREGDVVILQEQVCFLDELSQGFNVDRPEEALQPRETVAEEGQQISEWTTSLSALQAFVHRGVSDLR